jgi:phage terminase small subunit
MTGKAIDTAHREGHRRAPTAEHRRFLDAYLGPARYNATEAARMAGYAGHRVTLAQIGTKTRRTPQVAVAIEAERERYRAEMRAAMMVSMVGKHDKTSHFLARARKRKKLR